jgi:Slime mold cyclic AMP receptor
MEINFPRALLEMKLFQDQEFFVFKVLCFIACLISLLSSLSIILIFLFIKRVRNFAFKLVFYLSISDFCLNLSNIITIHTFRDLSGNDERAGSFCIAQAFLTTLFGLSSIIWPSLIAFSLWATIVKHYMNIEKNECLYIFNGFIVPICLSIMYQKFFLFFF